MSVLSYARANPLTCTGKAFLAKGFAIAAAITLAFLLSIRYAPCYSLLGHDNAIFMYGGQCILGGGKPYLSFWDLKPPGQFVLNAVAISLGGRWGVWAVLNTLFGFSVGLMAITLKKRFGLLPCIVGASLALYFSRVGFFYEGGNLTEETCSALNLLLLSGVLYNPRSLAYWIAFGCIGTLVFFTKQSCIGVPLAIGLALIIQSIHNRDRSIAGRALAYCTAGASSFLFLILAMHMLGILTEYWSANFEFIAVYARSHRFGKGAIALAFSSLRRFDVRGLLNPFLLSITACALWITICHRLQKLATARLFVLTLLISLPIEYVLISIPNRFLGHYFLVFVVLLALGVAVWTHLSLVIVQHWFLPTVGKMKRHIAIGILVTLSILTFSGPLSLTRIRPELKHNLLCDKITEPEKDVAAFLSSFKHDTPLLMWGSETRWNVLADLRSPTRYMYQVPLVFEDYDSSSRFIELINDLKCHPQSIIIDTLIGTPNALSDYDETNSLSEYRTIDMMKRPMPRYALTELRNYIHSRYRQHRVLHNGWVVYLPSSMPTESIR